MQNEIVLVTGGCGFIGSHIVDKLIEMGYYVVVADDLSTGKLENISRQVAFHNINLSTATESDLDILLASVDYVFHLAAIPLILYTVEHPLECHDANVTGTIKLLEACKKRGIKKLILSSTYCVYGKPDVLPISELAEIKLPSPYAVQKYMQELYVEMYSRLYGVPSVILRYFTVYGTRQSSDGSYPNVLGAFRKQKREKKCIDITGDGTQTRDFVHVFDVVDANILAMNSRFVDADVFNIGTGKSMMINDIAKYFDCEIKYIPKRSIEIEHIICDPTKSMRELKWSPKITFNEGIKNLTN